MKYYSNLAFRSFIAIYILAIIATICVSFFMFLLSGMGCSAGCPADYTEKVIGELLPPTVGVILFLICSLISLFLQQYKNRRLGYLMAILIPFDMYIIYKILPTIMNFINSYFSDNSMGVSNIGIIGIIFLTILVVIVIIIPFYVLGRLVKEDLLKK